MVITELLVNLTNCPLIKECMINSVLVQYAIMLIKMNGPELPG